MRRDRRLVLAEVAVVVPHGSLGCRHSGIHSDVLAVEAVLHILLVVLAPRRSSAVVVVCIRNFVAVVEGSADILHTAAAVACHTRMAVAAKVVLAVEGIRHIAAVEEGNRHNRCSAAVGRSHPAVRPGSPGLDSRTSHGGRVQVQIASPSEVLCLSVAKILLSLLCGRAAPKEKMADLVRNTP